MTVQAFVRPRVHALGQAATLRLDNAIRLYASTGGSNIIALVGGPGFGKTTAIEYLRESLPPRPAAAFLDEPMPAEVCNAARRGLVVYASCNAFADIKHV